MKKVYIFAALMALVTAILVYTYLRSVTIAAQPRYVDVVAAAQDIPAYTRISGDMLVIRQVAAGSQHNQSVLRADEAVGKVSDSNILAGETLLSGKLKALGDNRDALSYLVTDGMRALTISVDSVSGVGGFLRRDDLVDILVTIDLPVEQAEGSAEESEKRENATLPVAENIRVLAAGDSLAGSGEGGEDAYSTVTLLATAEQAQKIVFAMAEGRLTLLLRSVTDEGESRLPLVNRETLAE